MRIKDSSDEVASADPPNLRMSPNSSRYRSNMLEKIGIGKALSKRGCLMGRAGYPTFGRTRLVNVTSVVSSCRASITYFRRIERITETWIGRPSVDQDGKQPQFFFPDHAMYSYNNDNDTLDEQRHSQAQPAFALNPANIYLLRFEHQCW